MSGSLRLGTRGSALALAQAGTVAEALGSQTELVPIKTSDSAHGDKSRFVREIERALLDGEIDLGVHSAKDLPGELPDGLVLVGVPPREDCRDAWCGTGSSLDEVPEGARVGTSSLRRRSQLLALRPDLEIVELRGNVDTRLRRVREEELDGIVVALAGLRRLGVEDEAAFTFGEDELTPAPGQGALALEAREGDSGSAAAAAELTDPGALAELTCERAAVTSLQASCNTPLGVRARLEGEQLIVRGYAGLPDGSEWVADTIEGDGEDPASLGRKLADRMRSAGAAELLARAEAQAAGTAG